MDDAITEKLCEQCDTLFDVSDIKNSYVRDKKKYCSPKCQHQAAIDQRRKCDTRMTIDRDDFTQLQRLGKIVDVSPYNLNRKFIKICLRLYKKGKITAAMLMKQED